MKQNIVSIESARRGPVLQGPLPQPPTSAGKTNQYVRRSVVAMACLGITGRKIAQRFPLINEVEVAQVTKEELIVGGALLRLGRKAA